MKAAVIQSPKTAQVVETDRPKPGPSEVLIEVAAAGICGTDLHIYHGEYQAVYPITPGHEFSGVVATVGDEVRYFKPGDRVTADPNISCNRCQFCQRNEPNQCENHMAIGVTHPGGFAQYVTVPESNVFAIGELPFDEAAFIEPLACVVWGLKRVQIQPGDSVLVMGTGPMGCLITQAVSRAGATTVVATDILQSRLDLAAQLGATEVVLADGDHGERLKAYAPAGYDVVIDVTGLPSVLEEGFGYVRPRGKIWVFGVCPPQAQACFVPFDVFRKDLSIIGSFAVNRTFPEAIALIQSDAVNVGPLISHRLPLDLFSEALDIAENDPERMKVQFYFV
ncbi:MAG: zinc-dependent alcohol dehydrogenase family protein [Chloroflexota bacterium]|nr:zinc-dependent alcohol dehydrogenase family protein [Chloroflexota bacterium]